MKKSLSEACNPRRQISRNAFLNMLGYGTLLSLSSSGGVDVAKMKEVETVQKPLFKMANERDEVDMYSRALREVHDGYVGKTEKEIAV